MARLKRSTLFYYSLTDLPVMLSIFPAVVFLPKFYTSDMGVPLTVAATIMLVVRLFDLVSDPLMGYISDRTHSRWGRRRPWIVLAVPFMMAGVYMLYLPPDGAGAMHMLLWMAVMSLGTTLMLIPYYAWGAELSPDYNERSRITGARSMMGVVGNLLAQVAAVSAYFLYSDAGSREFLEIVGIAMLAVMPMCVLLTVTRVGESRDYERSVMPIRDGLKLMAGNGPFKRLAAAFLVSYTGLSITTPLYIFFIAFVLGAEGLAPIMLIIFYVSNFAAVPFWVWLSTRIGKHRAYVGSFALNRRGPPVLHAAGRGGFLVDDPGVHGHRLRRRRLCGAAQLDEGGRHRPRHPEERREPGCRLLFDLVASAEAAGIVRPDDRAPGARPVRLRSGPGSGQRAE